jgi:predicted transcriptional regulator
MSSTSTPALSSKVTPEQEALIRRFLAAYNAIDRELRHRTGLPKETSFSAVVRQFVDANNSWRSQRHRLLVVGELRNFLVHEEADPFDRLAVPVAEVVEALESMQRWLSQRVLPAFQREVVTVHASDTLASVLQTISKRDLSQFPVLDLEGRYCGLLTENGITRWLAHHTTGQQMTLVEFEEVSVAQVLEEEERRATAKFMSRNEPLEAVLVAFVEQPHLEAVLITETGKRHEKLLGIATRWDLDKAVYSR